MKQRNLTQETLGSALGVTHRAVGGWLSGSRPHKKKAQLLADYLKLPLEVLMNDRVELPWKNENKNSQTKVKEDKGSYGASNSWEDQAIAWKDRALTAEAKLSLLETELKSLTQKFWE